MFQGDKLMTKDGQEWEAPRNANSSWVALLYRFLGGSGGCYFSNSTKDLDAFISRQGLSSDTKHKASTSLSDAGSNKKRGLAVFDPSRDDIIAHEGWHDIQTYLLRNYPDISSKLETAIINREAAISHFISNTKGLGYSAKYVFEQIQADGEKIRDILLSVRHNRILGRSGTKRWIAFWCRLEAVPMMLQSYKSSKNKQAQDLLSEIFAEAGLNPEFFKHF